MSQIIVSAKELINKKEQLIRLKDRYESLIKKLEARSKSLDKMWDGEAKKQYQISMSLDIAKLVAFVQLLIEIINILSTIITTYQNMEQKNIAIASGH